MPLAPLNLLLVDAVADRRLGLHEALTAAGHRVVGVATGLQDLDAQVRALSPDVILIEADSPDRDTLEHLAVVLAGAPRAVVLGCERQDLDFIRDAVRAGVSAYVTAGIAHARLGPVLAEAVARFESLQTLRAERDLARNEIAERKLIERAKGILMRERRCDEDTAFRMLRRLSQERGVTLAALSEQLIEAARHLR